MPDLVVRVDNSAGFTSPPSACPRRARTLFIDFVHHGDGYELRIHGSAMPEDGGDRWYARVQVPLTTVNDWIRHLHDQWESRMIRWHRSRGRGGRDYEATYPFAGHVDLRAEIDPVDREAMWRSLARAGHDLYRLLFHGPNDEIKWIGDRLAEALRSGYQTICVHSDGVVVPWAMLYVPSNPAETFAEGSVVDRTGFWGLRHLIEHRFNGPAPTESHTRFARRPLAGSFIDPTIRTPQRLDVAEPALRLLKVGTVLTEGTRSTDLETGLRGPARAYHLMYFSCHCVSDGNGAARLRLADEEVSVNNFDIWLQGRGLSANPLVFITACRATDVGASPHHFSRTLLAKGANCLVGPYVNIPAAFARRFAVRLLSRVLRPGVPVGEAVHAAACFFADRYDNPLGLTYSVYHGTDSHLCLEDSDGLVAA